MGRKCYPRWVLEQGLQAEYRAWSNMKQRCLNPARVKDFQYYKAKGITVCDRWLRDFDAFLVSVGRRPSPVHSLDRYPNREGNYEPGNVRWATQREQSENRCNVHAIEFQGETLTLAEVCRRTKMPYSLVFTRLKRGHTIDVALSGTSRMRRDLATYLRGDRNTSSKLSDEQVRCIRDLRPRGKQVYLVASQFGISRAHVYDIVAGKRRVQIVSN